MAGLESHMTYDHSTRIRPTKCRNRAVCVSLTALFLSSAGCEEPPDIIERVVPKPPGESTPKLDTPAMPKPSDLKASERRILAAAVPLDGKGWFFKLDGRRTRVLVELPRFVSLLKSLKVSDGSLTWTAPEGWKATGRSGIREETFSIADNLECSVIALGADDPTTTEYLLSNINRWRGQIELPAISTAELLAELDAADSGEIQQFKLADGRPVTWVNIAGKAESEVDQDDLAGTSDNPPAGTTEKNDKTNSQPKLGPAGPPGSEPAENSTTRRAGIPGLTFDVPVSWQRGRMAVMRQIAWQVTAGDRKLEIYISKLSAEGSQLGPNINRWRTQVGLKSLPDDILQNGIEEMKIGGRKGHFVELRGAESSILGAVVIHKDAGYFFKAFGDPQLAKQELKNFRAFVQSVKFK